MTRSRPAPTATSLLTLEGPDALAFAHAQFTSNVAALEPGKWQWSAWLDARGRVQFLFHLARAGEQALVALLRGGDAATMAKRLGPFRFRSRVTLSAHPAVPVGGGKDLPAFRFEAEGGSHTFGLGDRSLVLPDPGSTATGWRLEAIRRGEPWLPEPFLGSFLPPALGLHRLGALSLDKGCYPGQEIVARLHYHGGHKHALAHLRLHGPVAPGATALPAPPGSADSAAIAAQVLDCVPAGDLHEALAVLHHSVFDRLRDTPHAHADAPQLVRRFES